MLMPFTAQICRRASRAYSAASGSLLTVNATEGVGILTVTRPEALNALNSEVS